MMEERLKAASPIATVFLHYVAKISDLLATHPDA
jgi:hypothetical protein